MEDSFASTPIREGITLTDKQQEVHDQLLSYATEQKTRYPFAVFKGYAGVGKSTVIGKLILKLIDRMPAMRIGVAATTHKAVKVLKREGIREINYRTIHSWLKLKESYDNATGEQIFIPDTFDKNPPPISDLEVLIVDETSMLAREIWEYMVPWMKKGLKVIFAGDPAQIPPVKQRDCIPFMHGKDWGALVVELTEVMRQKADSPILSYATDIREKYQQSGQSFIPKTQLNDKGEGIEVIRHGSTREKEILQQYFTDPRFAKDPDFMKVVSWTNKVADAYNNTIRQLIYQQASLPMLMPGEKLIMDRPFIITARNILPNNEEVEVVDLCTGTSMVKWADCWNIPDQAEFKVYQTTLRYFVNDEERLADVPVIHESSLDEFNKLILKLEGYALEAPQVMRGRMWRQKYKTFEMFGWMKYNYAVTGHKSQGSTYQNAMVLQWDIEENWRNEEERNRILYVACTRAKHLEFIEV